MSSLAYELTEPDDRLLAVRRRVWRAMIVPFVVVMTLAAIEGFATGRPDRTTALALVAAGILLPVAMILGARAILREFDSLDAARRDLGERYDRARLDAVRDGLTGLGNHRAFQEELVRQIELSKRHGTSLALLLIDVDDLKRVNDERGHVGGDEVLVEVGRITQAAMRRSDHAFRVGDDEFAVLLPRADQDEGLAAGRRILAAALGGGNPSSPIPPFSLSIGVSAFPNPTTASHLLYRNTDAALFSGKRHGRTAVIGFDPSRHGASSQDRSVDELSTAVAEVLRTGALRAAYQPIYSVSTGHRIGYEALVRPAVGVSFQDATALFEAAEIAERTVELDLACLEIAAAGARDLEPDVYIALNISPRTLESTQFHPSELKRVFRRNGIPLDQVVLELTEREAVEDLAQLRKNVDACRAAGMRLAADDVGAGNAGLRLLNEIPFDIVKVDLSLVQGSGIPDPSHAVLRALQELAHRRKASIVAEGIETAEQLMIVRDLGIAAGQGYLLGRPATTRRAEHIDIEALLTAASDADAFVVDGEGVAEPAA